MPLTVGIIGLPNVGKSTLYNALTQADALTANYPFTTIEPNVGNVIIPDERLTHLSALLKPEKVTPTAIEFSDIAGLVKGAHKGEGLGNQFLAHIRSVDAILHVVRCFDDDQVTHVDGNIDALRDIEVIEIELMLADLEIIEKRIPKIEKKAILNVDLQLTKEFELLKFLADGLKSSIPIRKHTLTDFELETIKPYGFLTLKPIIYVCNIGESDLHDTISHPEVSRIIEHGRNNGIKVFTICADLESLMGTLDEEERHLYLETLDLHETGVSEMLKAVYDLLDLETFFTSENNKLRAWTFKKGYTAKQCAGIIHSDFERGFIRAEVIKVDELIKIGNLGEAKNLGKIRSEGKSYLVQDGDVIVFRFNV